MLVTQYLGSFLAGTISLWFLLFPLPELSMVSAKVNSMPKATCIHDSFCRSLARLPASSEVLSAGSFSTHQTGIRSRKIASELLLNDLR